MALLRDVDCSPAGRFVGSARGPTITGHLKQVRPDRVESMVLRDRFAGREPVKELQSHVWASCHGYSNSVVQRHNAVVGDTQEQLV